MSETLHTVVELPSFLRDASALFSDDERGEILGYLARNPETGDLIPRRGDPGVSDRRVCEECPGGSPEDRSAQHAAAHGRDREELRETTALEKKTAGQRIIEVLQEAVRFSKGEPVTGAVVTQVKLPVVDIRKVRQKMKLSQTEFARRFGFAPASLRNWEQGRSEPDGPARVLLAVIARHPEAVEDALTSLRRAG